MGGSHFAVRADSPIGVPGMGKVAARFQRRLSGRGVAVSGVCALRRAVLVVCGRRSRTGQSFLLFGAGRGRLSYSSWLGSPGGAMGSVLPWSDGRLSSGVPRRVLLANARSCNAALAAVAHRRMFLRNKASSMPPSSLPRRQADFPATSNSCTPHKPTRLSFCLTAGHGGVVIRARVAWRRFSVGRHGG